METLDLNDDELKALGKKLGAGVKTEEELVKLTKTLRKAMIEAALGSQEGAYACTTQRIPASTLLWIPASQLSRTVKAHSADVAGRVARGKQRYRQDSDGNLSWL